MNLGTTDDTQAPPSPATQRLQSELRRLFLPLSLPLTPTTDDSPAPSADLVDAQGQTRAMVLELTRPAEWGALAAVWRGVQTELEWPAPGIAVSGVDGLQLWFSLERPEPLARAHALLESLRTRFLPDVAAKRVRLWPAAVATAATAPEPARSRHARLVPSQDERSGQWSAFVSRDLASVFGDTPWLDEPPSQEGQATLLRGLVSIKQLPADVGAPTRPVVPETPVALARPAAGGGLGVAAAPVAVTLDDDHEDDPRRFLLQVMKDANAPLALRIEAAKALLPRRDGCGGPRAPTA